VERIEDSVEETIALRWRELGRRLGIAVSFWFYEWQRLHAAYSEPDRHYHNLRHLLDMFAIIDQLELQEPDSVELSVFFHDVVYDPQRQNNEEASAAWAAESLSAAGIDAQLIERVKHLILATKSHQVEAGDHDATALLDADLSILGESSRMYQRYAENIWMEYSFVPEAQYQVARKQVLQRFLERDRIYQTEMVYQRLEARARQNLQHEMQRL